MDARFIRGMGSRSNFKCRITKIKPDDLFACDLGGRRAHCRGIIPNFALNRATRFTASIYFHTKYESSSNGDLLKRHGNSASFKIDFQPESLREYLLHTISLSRGNTLNPDFALSAMQQRARRHAHARVLIISML